MHSKALFARATARSVALWFALIGLGCAGNAQDEGTNNPGVTGGTTVPSPDHQVRQGLCLELTQTSTHTSYTRKTWDAAQRILTAELSASETFDEVDTLKWRYRGDGQVIAYVGGPSDLSLGSQDFQYDYDYDEHDNETDFYASNPAHPDPTHPATTMRALVRTHTNEYDDAGRLVRSTVAHYGDAAESQPNFTSTLTEDAQGRCSIIDSDNSNLTTLHYDDAGLLVKIENNDNAANGLRCPHSTTTSTYDEQARLLSSTQECSGGGYGETTSWSHYSYLDDGSQKIESFDGSTDVSDDAHSLETRSAGCATIDAAIGAPTDQRCRASQAR